MINFNSLPKDRPTNLPATGTYYATIENAEMKKGQDITKPAYLNILLALQDAQGRNCGKVYDILAESDKELVQFKIARFLTALGLDQLGTFELTDLVKVIKNKQLIVDIKQEEAKNNFPAKSIVDVFKGNIYYPMSEASSIFGAPAPTAKPTNLDIFPDEDELTIDASDAADVHATTDDDF